MMTFSLIWQVAGAFKEKHKNDFMKWTLSLSHVYKTDNMEKRIG